MSDSTAKRCLAMCPLFEAELLLQLMMRNWKHPLAEDEAFRQSLIESATELLIVASDEGCSQEFFDGLPARELNFVAAVWYVEWCGVQDDGKEREARIKWLNDVRRSLPSCFCRGDFLEP